MPERQFDLPGGASCSLAQASIFPTETPRKFSSRNITKLYVFWYSLEVVHKELNAYGR